MDKILSNETWWLGQLRPNCLKIAERNLVRQGFRVFCPSEAGTRRRGDRFVSFIAPLFPGYIFIGSGDSAAPLRAINSTYGVSRLVNSSDQKPAEVPEAIVAGLMARCDQSGLIKAADTLAPGEQVRIVSGPFADFIGTVETIAAQERVWILLELLGGATRVALNNSSVQRA
jgi:transcriptional antiterminator RfaH